MGYNGEERRASGNISQTLGRIEGKLDGIDDKLKGHGEWLQQHQDEMAKHSQDDNARFTALGNEQIRTRTILWMVGGILTVLWGGVVALIEWWKKG